MTDGWKTPVETAAREGSRPARTHRLAGTLLALTLATAHLLMPIDALARVQDPAPAAQAATPAPGGRPDVPEPPDIADGPDGEVLVTWSRPVVRVSQDFELREGERAREVVVVFGSATIAGEVDRDVVVVLGGARLLPTARIRGSLVVTAGQVSIAEGATVGRDLVVSAGGVDIPPSFHPGGDYVVVGIPGFAGQGEALVPWFTQGLMWGRLIVPSLGWLWPVVTIIVLVYLAMALLFHRPVRACSDTLAQRPLSAFLVGLLALMLIGPLSFVLAVSVIGIPVIPFVACGLLIAALLGKVGVSRWIGSQLLTETEPENRWQGVRSFLIGSAVILLAYMVPVLGILVWAVSGLLGLGAATVAFSSGLRRENKSAVPPVPPTPVSVPLTPSPVGYTPLDVDNGVPGAPMSAVAEDVPFAAPVPPVPPVVPPAPPRPAVPAGALVAMPKAPFLDRLGAFALDVLLVSLAHNLLNMHGARAFFTLLLAYHIVFWGLKATTVGGIICNLRITRVDGAPFTFTDALIRGFSSIFSIAALGIGCLWILFDSDNQSWHDRFAGTWVVKVPKNWPL
jgi:uncharacterized RDD family membrane protein YckC